MIQETSQQTGRPYSEKNRPRFNEWVCLIPPQDGLQSANLLEGKKTGLWQGLAAGIALGAVIGFAAGWFAGTRIHPVHKKVQQQVIQKSVRGAGVKHGSHVIVPASPAASAGSGYKPTGGASQMNAPNVPVGRALPGNILKAGTEAGSGLPSAGVKGVEKP